MCEKQQQTIHFPQPARAISLILIIFFLALFAASDLIMCRGEHRIESKISPTDKQAHKKVSQTFRRRRHQK
jgi:hypothetical protein